MALVTTMLSAIGGGGGGGGGSSVTGTILQPVIAASTANLTATYANGSAGIGATLTNGSSNLTAARVATTTALTVTYSNGASGVGATLTNNGAQAAISIDSVALSLNDRVLVKDQAAPAQNGVYSVTTVGTGSTNWVLTRVTDFDQAAEMIAGTQISITAGTTNTGTKWILSATITTVGTDAISFVATAAFSIDGVSPSVGQRVLIKNQTSALQNGVYSVTTAGSATVDWVLTRTNDFDEIAEIVVGVIVEVASGTINAATLWEQTATVAAIGTDSITFTAMSQVGLTASRALVTDANGKVAVATTTATEIGYVNGVTSSIQTQLNNQYPGRLSSVQVLTSGSAATYTVPAGINKILVECIGGGGGGGGQTTTAITFTAGGGGGSGGYCCKLIATTPAATFTYTVGAGGGGNSGAAGTNGSDTTFGTLTASGGIGGGAGPVLAASGPFGSGGLGGAASGGDINVRGGIGGNGSVNSSLGSFSGAGGESHYGGNTNFVIVTTATNTNGIAGAANSGAGGSGGAGNAAAAANTGGAGGSGVIVVWEYS